jgi:hypothetical protein
VSAQFSNFASRIHEVRHGDALEIAGFSVHVYGEKHALIHRDIPPVENSCFLVDGELFHPGDSFTVPEDPVLTLLLPISAPWLKAGEMIDYFRAVAPARGYAIHDAILNDAGLGLMSRMMSVAAAPSGAPVARLEPGASLGATPRCATPGWRSPRCDLALPDPATSGYAGAGTAVRRWVPV